MLDVLFGDFAVARWSLWPPERIRVVNWNIDRGLKFDEITDFLDAQRADILVLQEVDLHARRTKYRNIAEEIAKKLRMDYAFGYEFQELTQGRGGVPAYHGQATLSRWHLKGARVIRFRRQSNFWEPRWFVPESDPFQRRRGGRIALISEISIWRCRLVVYNLHLESRGDNQLRLAQLSEALEDAKSYLGSRPILFGGDLNIDIAHSPGAAVLQRLGFHSAVALPAPHTTPGTLLQHPRTIDWVYLAGPIESASGRVLRNVNASDHYPISLEIKIA